MLFSNSIPQRLDSGATPTFAGITGPNGQTITGGASGAWTIAANGTAQGVTLSATGVFYLASSSVVSQLNLFSILQPSAPSGGANGPYSIIGVGASNYDSLATQFVNAGGTGSTSNYATLCMYGLSNQFVIHGSGNVLIGTNVNSGARLQVGTNTTTSAGGMVFGTDTFLYRYATGALGIDTSGTTPTIGFFVSGVNKGYLQWNGADFILGGVSSNTKVLSNNAVAATFDTTQGLSLAGRLALNGASVSTSTALLTSAGTTAVSSLRIPHGAAPTTPTDGDMWTTTAGAFIRINGVTKSFTLV